MTNEVEINSGGYFPQESQTAAEIQNSRQPVYFMEVLKESEELEKELGM